MSMMSEDLMPSACEVDVTGVLTMYAMQLASNSPSALVDWNNNYGADENKCVLFHCGNWAKSFLPDIKVSTAPILGTIVGEKQTYGALEGRTMGGRSTDSCNVLFLTGRGLSAVSASSQAFIPRDKNSAKP